MYTLRMINEKNIERNISIGDDYVLVLKKHSPEMFKSIFDDYGFDAKAALEHIYGFVNNNPIWDDQRNFIMTESDQTFARI